MSPNGARSTSNLSGGGIIQSLNILKIPSIIGARIATTVAFSPIVTDDASSNPVDAYCVFSLLFIIFVK